MCHCNSWGEQEEEKLDDKEINGYRRHGHAKNLNSRSLRLSSLKELLNEKTEKPDICWKSEADTVRNL